MPIHQSNLIEKLALRDVFSTIKQGETESTASTLSFDDLTLCASGSTTFFTGSANIECTQGMNIDADIRKIVQVHFLRKMSAIPAIAFWLVAADDPMRKTSWMPLKRDEIDELREIAIRSRYHSTDIGVELSRDVLSFCYKYKIMEYVKTSVDLIKFCFPSRERISVELMEDTETDEKWVLLNIFVRDEINRILDMYDKYTEEWIDKVPWPECSSVRISYHPI